MICIFRSSPLVSTPAGRFTLRKNVMAITAFRVVENNHVAACAPREVDMIEDCLWLLVCSLGCFPTIAFAQLEATPERRAACMADAIMLCSTAIPLPGVEDGPANAALPRTIR